MSLPQSVDPDEARQRRITLLSESVIDLDVAIRDFEHLLADVQADLAHAQRQRAEILIELAELGHDRAPRLPDVGLRLIRKDG